MRKIVFTDLDGTLLDDNRQITEKNRKAIQKALSGGHQIVITSGRPLASVKQIAADLKLDGDGCYCIASNGAVLYDCGNNKVLRQTTLSKEYIKPLFKSAHEDNIHIHTYTDDYVICEEDREEIHWYENEIKVPALIVDSVYDYIDFNPVKIILLDLNNQQRLINFQKKMLSFTEGKMETLFSSPKILEYCPLGVSKGNPVVELCKLLNVPIENTIAAGDAENDIPLLKAAHIGCCMQNGFESTKAAADYITTLNNNDSGFAEILEKFVL